MLNFALVTAPRLDHASHKADLDDALASIFTVLDPKNEHDLGGEAAIWFSGDIEYLAPMDNEWSSGPPEDVWNHLTEADRRARLEAFFDYMHRMQMSDVA